jgi:uncharacterized protein with FMN-binding domain
MKKYIPITLTLSVFFIIVYFKNQLLPKDVAPSSKGSTSTTNSTNANALYSDGVYEGSVEDAVYGLFQVSAIISNGKISDITLLRSPDDNPTSISINQNAFAVARQEALQKQSAEVDAVTGASDSVPAFSRSLTTALTKAKK